MFDLFTKPHTANNLFSLPPHTLNNSWYDTEHVRTFATGTIGGTSWSGKMVGVAQYDKAQGIDPIVLKLETGKESDWFIGFNRKIGANSDVKQGGNLVTLYTVTDGDGLEYSHSFLQGTIGNGGTFRVTNWRNSGYALDIKVNDINYNVLPAYADVEITFGPQQNPTPNPTPKPTNNPTPEPTEVRVSKLFLNDFDIYI